MTTVRNIKLSRARRGARFRVTVTMESRGDEKIEVADQLDANFLRAADRFQMKAQKITGTLPERREA